jgi:hypothetical protein
MNKTEKTVKRIVFALILAASMVALSAPASAEPGIGVTWDAPVLPDLPLGATWE